MTNKKTTQGDDNFQAIESSLTRTEQFIENNQKLLIIGFIVIIAIVAIVLGFNKYYLSPLETEAQEQIFVAQQYFERDSFNLALNGDGQYPGFLEIIDDYGFTKVSNIANLYAGISYNKLGQYDNAIDYLSDFDSDDLMLEPVKNGNLGDAFAQKGDIKKALGYYKKAGFENENDNTSPIYLMKYGRACEETNDFKAALEAYKLIKTKYAATEEGRNIDKFIVRAEKNIK